MTLKINGNCKKCCNNHTTFIDLSYSHLPFEEAAIIRYADYTRLNALVEPKKIHKFNLEWLKFIKENHNDILIEFRNTINYETVDAKLYPLCEKFMIDFFRKNK